MNVESIRAWEHGRNMPNGHHLVRLIQLGVIDPSPKTGARK
jgi:DNA-binding transcriptional regulator YiaG